MIDWLIDWSSHECREIYDNFECVFDSLKLQDTPIIDELKESFVDDVEWFAATVRQYIKTLVLFRNRLWSCIAACLWTF